MATRPSVLATVAGLAVGVFHNARATTPPGAAQAADQPVVAMPFDLAFTRKTFGVEDQPVLSPDGKMVAYAVYTPPVRSPASGLPREPRFLPNGTPASSVGCRILLTHILTGKTQTICPDTGNCWRPSWSPDSRLVAFYSDAGGPPQLWAFDVGTGRSRRVSDVAIKAKLWMGDQAYWGPGGREVYVPLDLALAEQTRGSSDASQGRSTEAQVKVYRHGRETEKQEADRKPEGLTAHFLRENNASLGAVDVVSGEVRIVATAETVPRPSCLRLSPGGKWISYLSVFRRNAPVSARSLYDLAIVPSGGGRLEVLANDVEVPDVDYFGETYRWHPKGDRLAYINDSRLWLAEQRQGNRWRSTPLAEQLGSLTPRPLEFIGDGKWILVGKAPAEAQVFYGDDPADLALVPLDGGRPKIVPLGAKWRYRAVVSGRSKDRTPAPDTRHLTLVLEERATGETAIVQVDIESGAERVLWKESVRLNLIKGLADGGSFLGTLESFHTPPDIYWFSSDFASKRRVSHIDPRLDETRPGSAETFETLVPQFDGKPVKVRTAVLLPPGAKRGDRLPAVVMMYGGSRFSRLARAFGGGAPAALPVQLLATRGFAVMLADLPLGPEGQAGNPMQETADALLPQVYRAAELSYIDIERVAILGQSYGAYQAAAMTTVTNLFKAAVALSGLYDLPGNYARMGPDGTFSANWSETGQGRMGTHPWADPQRYIANSPYYQAAKINTPLLLVHGANDTVAVEESGKMFNALKRLDKTAQLAVYAGEGHVLYEWSLVNAVDAAKRIVEFLQKYLKHRASP